MRHRYSLPLVLTIAISGLLASCRGQESGTLEFFANGEDFVRQGFVSKDGWRIDFDRVDITLDEITAYQTDPAYDAHEGGKIVAQTQMRLDGPLTVNLAAGDENASPILAGKIANAPVGFYNALSWKLAPGESGYPIVIAGSAEKDGRTVDFTIQVETRYAYSCGEYIGDIRKGVLVDNGNADLEMTFHFDHIFGDAGLPMDDALNLGAPGFEPFANAAEAGTLDINLSGLQQALAAEDFQLLTAILPSLGHVGEGHCHSEISQDQ